MEKNKKDNKAFSNDGNNPSSIWAKTKETVVKSLDQNSDGKVNFKDVVAVTQTIGNAANNSAKALKDGAEARRRENDRARLQPIYIEDLESADFLLPKLIRITDIDKKYEESEICQGSIGYTTKQKELTIVNIFRNYIDAFNLTFFPDSDSEVYYADPSDRNHYIALENYFEYLKIVRVNELQRIAQSLGAKHFRVKYKEQKSILSDKAVKGKAGIKVGKSAGNVEGEHDVHSSDSSSVEIAAENIFPGHAPIEPKLHYLQREPAVLNLIQMRMNKTSPTQHESFSLSLINSSGIKEKDALKIDSALKAMKISGNIAVAREVHNEARKFFEFEVDF